MHALSSTAYVSPVSDAMSGFVCLCLCACVSGTMRLCGCLPHVCVRRLDVHMCVIIVSVFKAGWLTTQSGA